MSLDADVRCTRCGCAIDPSASSCAACGVPLAQTAPTSAGALGDQRYQLGPAPVARYDIALGGADSLNAAFALWTGNLKRLAALGFLPYALLIPLAAGGALLAFMPDVLANFDSGHGDDWWAMAIAGGVAFGALFMVLTFASVGACIHLVNEKTQGVDVTAGAALLSSLKHVGWLLVAYLALALCATVGVAAPMAPIIWAISEESWSIASMAPPLLVVTAAVVVLCARLLPALAVIVVEDTDAFTAIGRAWRLTRGRTTKVVGAALLFGLAYTGISMAVAMIGIVPIVGALVQMGVNAILVPLCYVFAFAVYAGCVREDSMRETERA